MTVPTSWAVTTLSTLTARSRSTSTSATCALILTIFWLRGIVLDGNGQGQGGAVLNRLPHVRTRLHHRVTFRVGDSAGPRTFVEGRAVGVALPHRTQDSGTSISVATICCSMVWVPVPTSTVGLRTVKVPSASAVNTPRPPPPI